MQAKSLTASLEKKISSLEGHKVCVIEMTVLVIG